MPTKESPPRQQDPRTGKLLSVREVAALLNCSPRSVYRLSDAGRMPAPVKLGALVRWDPAAIDEWVSAGCPTVRAAKGGAR